MRVTYVDDIAAAVAHLRSLGATKVVLMGASMGATMSVAAGAVVAPPVDGVIALSAPISFDGVSAEAAAPSLPAPALYIAGRRDGSFASFVTAIHAATPGTASDLLIVDSDSHGVRLLDPDVSARGQVRKAVEAFLAANAKP